VCVYTGTGEPLIKRQCGYGFESCWKKWDETRTVGGPHPLVGGLWRVPRTDVRDVIADSFCIIQVLHRPLTLLLYGCELFQFFTLRYCHVQADKSDTVRVTLYWRVFMQTCQVSQFLGSALTWGLLHGYGENLLPGGNAATLVVHRNISLTINIALSETVTEFSAFIRTQQRH